MELRSPSFRKSHLRAGVRHDCLRGALVGARITGVMSTSSRLCTWCQDGTEAVAVITIEAPEFGDQVMEMRCCAEHFDPIRQFLLRMAGEPVGN